MKKKRLKKENKKLKKKNKNQKGIGIKNNNVN